MLIADALVEDVCMCICVWRWVGRIFHDLLCLSLFKKQIRLILNKFNCKLTKLAKNLLANFLLK